MTAISLFLLLVAGSGAYVSWAGHRIAKGNPAWWFVAGAPLAYLLPVMLVAAIAFTLGWFWRTPRPPGQTLGPPDCVRLVFGEVAAIALSWPRMIIHRWLIRDPAAGPAGLPVLLVHGVLVNDGVWSSLRKDLMRRGLGPVYTINYGPPPADIEHFARQLASRIEGICSATGAARVALVGHSMGGLVARAYLRRYGATRIATVITVGTPHHGSILAWIVVGCCLAQMRPGSQWLASLNSGEGEVAPVPMLSIWSRHDSMVAPQASAELACARNVALVGIGHNALLNHRDVMDEVARALASAQADQAVGTVAGAARQAG